MNLSQLLSLFYIKMNYTFDLWDVQVSENSIGHFDYFYDAFSPNQHFYSGEQDQSSKQINPPTIMEPNCISLQAPNCDEHPSTSQFEPKQFKPPLRVRKNPCNSSQKLRKKKHMKSSPYHNYQKHLNNTLKQLLTLDTLSFQSSQEILIAHNLWNIFSKNESSTKKILNFIFNQYNEYPFKESDLEEFGFKQIYSNTPSKMLADARVYLTKVAINHLNEENIDRYLQTRRIKNPLKFKKYLMVFRKQLQDGFLKKRFTNRSRKEQLRKLREKQIQMSQ